MRRIRLAVFLFAVAAAAAGVAWGVGLAHWLREEGAALTFRAADVRSPGDGYVSFRMTPSSFGVEDFEEWRGKELCVVFGEDAEGLAVIDAILDAPPKDRPYLWLRVRMRAAWADDDCALIFFDMPFNRCRVNGAVPPGADCRVRVKTGAGRVVLDAFLVDGEVRGPR